MFALQNTPLDPLDLPGLRLRSISVEQCAAKFDLTLDLAHTPEGFAGHVEYNVELFDRATMQRMTDHFIRLLESIVANPQARIYELEMLQDAERQQLLIDWNATGAEYPRDQTVHGLFEEQVEKTPQAIAVICGDRRLSYAQLNDRANQLARVLSKSGVRTGGLVGLCVERGVEMLVGMLGILKSGGAYAPLDPSYPAERVQYMLEDMAPAAVLTQSHLAKGLSSGAAKLIALDTDWEQIAQEECGNLSSAEVAVSSSDLAYVIYTSGSTGQPKGVAIEHRNAVNLVCWARGAMAEDVFLRTLQSTSLNFDLSVYECFVPLSSGGAVEVVGNALALLSEPVPVTLINTVPSAIQGILEGGRIPPATRVVNLAGEPLKKDVVERIFAHSDVERVCNLYGPSETTTYSSWISMTREQGFLSTIGRPIANTRFYILDARRQPVPVGVEGEIYIGGSGVARGYLNRPQLTEERFVHDPFAPEPAARMYRTGDLGRWHVDGRIEYLGRNDHQVKIRGFRIELGEIEAHLAAHPQVKDAVVVMREDSPGDKRLVAYVVVRDGASPPAPTDLSVAVATRLPEHMVPKTYVFLGELPLTPTGKVDRKALPAPELRSHVEYVAPRDALEASLADIWRQLLRADRIGLHDNFFALGGHSLLVVQVVSRTREALGIDMPVSALFAFPTLEAFAIQARQLSPQAAFPTGADEEYETGII
jgi:amino acid adenylation domain-containing protein